MGYPAPSMIPTEILSDCGHSPTGPSAVVDQSNARIRAPISPPPPSTDSIKVVILLSVSRSASSAIESVPICCRRVSADRVECTPAYLTRRVSSMDLKGYEVAAEFYPPHYPPKIVCLNTSFCPRHSGPRPPVKEHTNVYV